MPKKANAGYDAEGRIKPKKLTLDQNGGIININSLLERDKGKVPLQINRTLTILVTKEKATPAYAEEYRQRMENKVFTH